MFRKSTDWFVLPAFPEREPSPDTQRLWLGLLPSLRYFLGVIEQRSSTLASRLRSA